MDLEEFDQLAAQDHHLVVVATARSDRSVQASVVNAGVLPHPLSGEPVVGFVTYGRAKLSNLRARPRATVVARAGWQWGAVEGPVDLLGPDDPFAGFDRTGVPELLRAVFRSAGGVHEDWEHFDQVMAEERRAAVLIHPERIYTNRA